MRQKVNKPADMITVPGRIYPDQGAQERLVSFMRRFQAAKRTAYQALRRGKEPGEIVRDLYDKFFSNARWCQWAVEDAKATIESQKEQVKIHVSDLEAKIGKSEEKLERTKDKLRRQGILARLDKLCGKLAYWKSFLERGEVPPAVFGGKRNLLLLQKGKLSKEEWRELRSDAFYSVGQANQKGLEGHTATPTRKWSLMKRPALSASTSTYRRKRKIKTVARGKKKTGLRYLWKYPAATGTCFCSTSPKARPTR